MAPEVKGLCRKTLRTEARGIPGHRPVRAVVTVVGRERRRQALAATWFAQRAAVASLEAP